MLWKKQVNAYLQNVEAELSSHQETQYESNTKMDKSKWLYGQPTSESYITVFFLLFSAVGVIHLKTFDNFGNVKF